VQFGHRINLATQRHGFITYSRIWDGKPANAVLYILYSMPVRVITRRSSAIADGCYGSQANVKSAKRGVKRNAFSKPVGLTLTDMM